MTTHNSTLQPATIDDLYEISMASAMATSHEICIYEKSDPNALIGKERAEELRTLFLRNQVKIKQLTNLASIPAFSPNDTFINSCMSFRYIPYEIFSIKHEILVFDNTVAIYNTAPEVSLLLIDDEDFAENQRQLFRALWDLGQPPKLGFPYTPNHSFFNSIDFTVAGKRVILYPDLDAPNAYGKPTYEELESELQKIIASEESHYADASYMIGFIWSYNGEKMLDLWKFNANYVDDRSGPLSEVRVYRNGKRTEALGMASGNTLLVLGYEERQRRQAALLEQYLSGPSPVLPLEIQNGLDFIPPQAHETREQR